MTTTAPNCALSNTDVQRLLSDHSAEARIETMSKLVSSLESDSLAGPGQRNGDISRHRPHRGTDAPAFP